MRINCIYHYLKSTHLSYSLLNNVNCVSPAQRAMYDTQNAVSKQFLTKKLDLHNSVITSNVLYSFQVAQVTNNKKGVLTQ